MRSNRVFTVLVALSLLVGGATALAQGIPTATVTGRVTNEEQGLPGVSVSAKSPALQGVRTTVTGATGEYAFVSVPPGQYTLTFALSGFQPATKSILLGASQTAQQNAVLSLTAVAAEATVVGRSEAISQTTAEATTYTAELLTKLPTTRTIQAAVILSPGLNQSGPNGISIAGAQSAENLWTVNGVVITDNVRSTPNTLFIEDAIQETTAMTSSVTAEYGRFTGGVINTITKSGGNTFSGSLRATYTNDAWSSTSGYRAPGTGVNPQEGTFINKATPTWEATFGGPILKDKLWFFGAGRYFDTSDARSTVTRFTNIPVTYGTKEDRYEGKLTFSPLQNHTLTGSYIGVDTTSHNFNFDVAADTNVYFNPSFPQNIAIINYNGVWTDSLFVDAFYSKRKFTFQNYGSVYTDLIRGTPIHDTSLGVVYNSPTFCGVCTPEPRNNDDVVVKGTYFLSTKGVGSHNVVAGYDDFGGQRKSNNYQSGSNFTLYTPSASIVKGTSIYPVIDAPAYVVYWPILQLSQGNDLRTQSVFLNDTWRLNNRLSFNLGVRYDKNHATDQGGNVTSNDSAWSPRLAGTFDVQGDGKLKVTASYAKYVAALQDTQAGSGATLAGSPAIFYWYYGDVPGYAPINADPTKPLLSPADALQQFFNVFGAAGCMPDPTAASCKTPLGGPPSISGVNVQIQGSLASPYANEYDLGISGAIGSRGSYRADIVRREYGNFYDLQKDVSTGKVSSPVNPAQKYDLGLIVNSNDYTRNYTGLHTQFAYHLSDRFNVGGNWTWSHLIGDLVGETSGSSVVRGGLHTYPEYQDRKWNAPVGDLSSDTRHRVRIYGTYEAPIPAKLGGLNVSVIQALDTGTPYSAVGSVRTGAYVTNPGYLTPPASVGYYFSARGAYRTEDVYRTDLALTYSYKIAGAVEIYVAPQIYNIFNSQHVISVNQTVNTAVNSSAFTAFNPFTTASPIECPQGQTAAQCKAMGANYQKGSLFGQPTAGSVWAANVLGGTGSYQNPRTFQVSVGVRF
jgi:outer membrane receptor protein involved in Fe transport